MPRTLLIITELYLEASESLCLGCDWNFIFAWVCVWSIAWSLVYKLVFKAALFLCWSSSFQLCYNAHWYFIRLEIFAWNITSRETSKCVSLLFTSFR